MPIWAWGDGCVGALASGGLHDGTFDDDARGHIFPQRDEQPFRIEDGGKAGADTFEVEQCRRRAFGNFGGKQRIALGLHFLDLGDHQFEPVELATDLRL